MRVHIYKYGLQWIYGRNVSSGIIFWFCTYCAHFPGIDIKEPVVTICRNYLDKFQGRSSVSTYWLNLDHEWFKRKFPILEPDFYLKKMEIILKVKILKHIKP